MLNDDIWYNWCWLVPIDADWCWLVLMDSHLYWFILIGWCWLMLIDIDWCWFLPSFSFVGAYLRSFSSFCFIVKIITMMKMKSRAIKRQWKSGESSFISNRRMSFIVSPCWSIQCIYCGNCHHHNNHLHQYQYINMIIYNTIIIMYNIFNFETEQHSFVIITKLFHFLLSSLIVDGGHAQNTSTSD